MVDIENIILQNLFHNKNYVSKVLPYLKKRYFDDISEQIIFTEIKSYIKKYKKLPSYSVIKIGVSKLNNISEKQYDNISDYVTNLEKIGKETYELSWLLDETEIWCINQSVYQAVSEAAEMINNKKDLSTLPDMMRKAVSIEFQSKLGSDFFDKKDINNRWEYYTMTKIKYPTHIKKLNTITNGGIEPKTINILMGDYGCGKTNALISLGAGHVMDKRKVLYVSLEMSREQIGQRFDAHFLKIPINEIELLDESNFKKTLSNLGHDELLRIEEYPTSMAGVNHIRALLNDLKVKENFIPDILIVDYLNIMKSTMVSKNKGSYEYVKSITEELRAVAVEYELGIWTATQTNRGASNSNDIKKSDTSESYGVGATVDLQIGLITPEDLKKQGIQIWKDLKDRYSGSDGLKFAVRIDFSRASVIDYVGDISQIFDEDEDVKFNSKKQDKIIKIKKNLTSSKNNDTIHTIKDKFMELVDG